MDNMMQAEISYWETTFSGNYFEIKEYKKEYRLRARQELPDDGVHYIDFWIPLSVPQHGQEVKIELLSNPVSPADPPQARGEYSRFLAGGSGRLLPSRSGTLKLNYDRETERMWGTFNFEASLNTSQTVYVTNGAFDITGITNALPDAADKDGRATTTLQATFPDGGEDVIVNGEFDIRD